MTDENFPDSPDSPSSPDRQIRQPYEDEERFVISGIHESVADIIEQDHRLDLELRAGVAKMTPDIVQAVAEGGPDAVRGLFDSYLTSNDPQIRAAASEILSNGQLHEIRSKVETEGNETLKQFEANDDAVMKNRTVDTMMNWSRIQLEVAQGFLMSADVAREREHDLHDHVDDGTLEPQMISDSAKADTARRLTDKLTEAARNGESPELAVIFVLEMDYPDYRSTSGLVYRLAQMYVQNINTVTEDVRSLGDDPSPAELESKISPEFDYAHNMLIRFNEDKQKRTPLL